MTDPASPTPFGARDLMIAGVMNLMWGLNVIAVKSAVDLVSPMTAGFLRQVIVLAVCVWGLRIVPGRMRELTALGLLSGGVFYLLINLSLAVADNVSALAIAGQLGVPFSLLLAVLLYRERIHWPRIVGIALSFAGVGLLAFDPAIADEALGLALTAAGCLVWAIGSLVQRRLTGVPLVTIYAWIGLWGAVVLGVAALLAEPDALAQVPALPASAWGWIAFSAIGSTLMGHGAMSWLLQRHPVSTVTPLTLAAPVISVVVAAAWFHTPVTALMMLGGVLTLIGVAIVALRTAWVKEVEPT